MRLFFHSINIRAAACYNMPVIVTARWSIVEIILNAVIDSQPKNRKASSALFSLRLSCARSVAL